MIDIINQKILSELKKNSRIAWGTLASIVGISRQSLKARIDRLEHKKHILAYTIITSHQSHEQTNQVKAFLKIRFSKGYDCFKLANIFPSYKNIIAAWAITGDWDSIILVQANSMQNISEIREIIIATGGIDEIETDVIMNDLYNTQK